MVIPGDRGGTFGGLGGTLGVRSSALAPPWAVAIRHLLYREDSFGVAFRSLLAGHRREQTQIVMFDGEIATPQLKVADGAMFVQDQRGRLSALLSCPDRLNGLARPGDVIPDAHGSVAVPSP